MEAIGKKLPDFRHLTYLHPYSAFITTTTNTLPPIPSQSLYLFSSFYCFVYSGTPGISPFLTCKSNFPSLFGHADQHIQMLLICHIKKKKKHSLDLTSHSKFCSSSLFHFLAKLWKRAAWIYRLHCTPPILAWSHYNQAFFSITPEIVLSRPLKTSR